mgnify:FL=1|jgi:hypothetical protein
MKLKGNYDITESGRYTVIFEDENGEEWEVEFELWIDKEYHYEETGRFLIDVNVQAKCLSPGFSIDEEVEMEISLQEYITDSFNL